MQRHSISVVIPVFNSESSVETVVERTRQALAEAGATAVEFVLVDDASSDGSWEVLQRIARGSTDVRVMKLARNFGQHNALLAGIRSAAGDVIVTIDDDLQHDPRDIATLIAELDRGFDVVYGSPRRQTHGFLRNAASWMTKLALQHAMGATVATKVSAFRVFRTRLRRAFEHYTGPYVSIDVLLTWATRRFSLVTVEHHERPVGTSNYTLAKLLRHALTMVTGFSTLPLRLASIIGFGATLFGIALLAYVLINFFLHGRAVPGFAFLASMTAIFSGVQLFALGIMGEYLARMHVRLMDQPSYIVDDSLPPEAG